MNDSKSKFTIKKGASALRLKINSADELQFQSQTGKPGDGLDRGKFLTSQMDGLTLHSREPKLIKRQVHEKFDKEIFASRYSPDDNKIAVTMLDGTLAILSTKEDNRRYSKALVDGTPATSVLWKNSRDLIVGDTQGNIHDLTFEKATGEIKSIGRYSDPEEQILAIEHSPQLGITLYAGKSMKITVLNDQTKKPIKVFEPGDTYAIGHTNRIFALKFAENAPNTFVSAGWDGTMFLWDIRTNKAANSVFGPVLSGDSLDISDNLILAGSYRDKDSLELYDIRTFKKICNVDWSLSLNQFNYVSSCRFSKNKDEGAYIIAASCLSNQVGLFKKDIVYQNELVIGGLKKGVYTCGFANSEAKFYFGTSDGEFNVFHYFNL